MSFHSLLKGWAKKKGVEDHAHFVPALADVYVRNLELQCKNVRKKTLGTDGDVNFSKVTGKIREEMVRRRGQTIVSTHNSNWKYPISNAKRVQMPVL